MVGALKVTEFIREDTKELVDLAGKGEFPCSYCKEGERGGCVNVCRAWPIWFSVHWQNLQKQLQR